MKIKLMLGMLAMAALLACTVVFLSPYAPAVGPVTEIEEIWAIEDAREESDMPLVTCLENNGMRLGYDAQENTFYCPIGLGNADAWPQLHLTAPNAKGVQLCFVDDYGYDWCDEAVREGYAYQILAYTAEQFWYTQVVFTGLPVICLETDAEISREEQLGFAAISADGAEPIQADARISYRGAGTYVYDKKGYRIEFAGNSRGGRLEYDVPGIGMESKLALLPMTLDAIMMREKLSWDLYAAVAGKDTLFSPRKTQYIELFVNDEYAGVYLMINLPDIQKEMRLAGESHVRNDSLYRTTYMPLEKERMVVPDPLEPGSEMGYELHRSTSPGHEFDALQPYLALCTEQDDALFERRVLEVIDLDQMLRYDLFVQACGLTDNFRNNMYIWAEKTDAGIWYTFWPWDLDQSWGLYPKKIGEGFDCWLYFPFFDRIINLNAGGARGRLAQIWREMREEIFTQENVAGLLEQYTNELSESGAMMRNEARWNVGMSYPDGQNIVDFAATRFAFMDEFTEMIAGTDEPLALLEASRGDTKDIPAVGE
ncbi:MAG: CotH kinase family protein [Candidatus Ventricola sp.]